MTYICWVSTDTFLAAIGLKFSGYAPQGLMSSLLKFQRSNYSRSSVLMYKLLNDT